MGFGCSLRSDRRGLTAVLLRCYGDVVPCAYGAVNSISPWLPGLWTATVAPRVVALMTREDIDDDDI